jgi:hypothetical protein
MENIKGVKKQKILDMSDLVWSKVVYVILTFLLELKITHT